ncbi:heme-dependent oxidative N-demethylase family protein [Devosia sp.]|uniref:heme-dependent oxidative N-demethylase family protein n=1 Tax=Devosia sp. TaxID=1871048 RepID=UPI003BACBBB6
MPPPLHTPYDGSARPFQIGLKPLDPDTWIDVDGRLGEYLDEKARLRGSHRDEVFVAEAGTEAAQGEVLAMLVEHLPRRFPEIYQRRGTEMEIIPLRRAVPLAEAGLAPLQVAASLVQEDLVLLRRSENGWRLVAAALDFPSSWSLRAKFGRPMHEVHGPVPGFGVGTRNAAMIERMFDHLRVEMPVIRWNWSLFGDERLFHPEGGHPDQPRFGVDGESVYLRVERQTLRKLPVSGDILFTIRISVDPLAALTQHAEAATIATALIEQLEALSPEQVRYKGLRHDREALVARLSAMAGRAQ